MKGRADGNRILISLIKSGFAGKRAENHHRRSKIQTPVAQGIAETKGKWYTNTSS